MVGKRSSDIRFSQSMLIGIGTSRRDRGIARTSVIDLYRLLAKKIQPPFKPSVVRVYLFVFTER
jgi:hypothetical protein